MKFQDSNAGDVKLYRHYSAPGHNFGDLRISILQKCAKPEDFPEAEGEWIW